MGSLSTCIAIILGCTLKVYAQVPMLEQLMANPAMAMAMMNGGQGAGAMNPLMMSAMMNPMASSGEPSSFNEMAMMNMMLNRNRALGGGSMLGTQSRTPPPANSNGTSAGSWMGRPQSPVNRGPNINDVMSMMMLSNSGSTPSTETLQRVAARGALVRSNTRILNPTLRPNQLMDFAKDGLGVSAVIAKQVCPPQQCPFRVPCESPIIIYKPETYFVCPECPKCPLQIVMGAMNPTFNSMGSVPRRPMMRRNMMGRQRPGRTMPMRVIPMDTTSRNATARAA